MDHIQTTDKVIADILAHGGKDYTPAKQNIADLFNDILWCGNWDATTELDPALGLPNLRFIQEDEYDQVMDNQGVPNQICYTCGHYVFTA